MFQLALFGRTVTKESQHRQRIIAIARVVQAESVMDAKWNRIIDNGAVRIGMIVAIFGVWLAISYGLLAA